MCGAKNNLHVNSHVIIFAPHIISSFPNPLYLLPRPPSLTHAYPHHPTRRERLRSIDIVTQISAQRRRRRVVAFFICPRTARCRPKTPLDAPCRRRRLTAPAVRPSRLPPWGSRRPNGSGSVWLVSEIAPPWRTFVQPVVQAKARQGKAGQGKAGQGKAGLVQGQASFPGAGYNGQILLSLSEVHVEGT